MSAITTTTTRTRGNAAMNEELAKRVRAARAYAEITQEDMASRLGLSTVTYKRIEAAKRELTLDEVARISEITLMPLDFFTKDLQELGQTAEHQQQLESMREELKALVDRLGDIEWHMRRTVEGTSNNDPT